MTFQLMLSYNLYSGEVTRNHVKSLFLNYHENRGFLSIFPWILGFCCRTKPRNIHMDLPVQKQILHAVSAMLNGSFPRRLLLACATAGRKLGNRKSHACECKDIWSAYMYVCVYNSIHMYLYVYIYIRICVVYIYIYINIVDIHVYVLISSNDFRWNVCPE